MHLGLTTKSTIYFVDFVSGPSNNIVDQSKPGYKVNG
jgi:hypothetical protein